MYDTLILSGNSTNVISTMGSLQRLFEESFLKNIVNFVGTSSGAMLSILLAVGCEPVELLSFLCYNNIYSKISGFNLSNFIFQEALIDFAPIEISFSNLIIEKIGFIPTLAQVKQMFNATIVATVYNLTDSKKEYLSFETYPDMSIVDTFKASCAFPFIFKPHEYNGKFYVDGGIVDNFPIRFAQSIGTNCLGLYNEMNIEPYNPDGNRLDFFLKILQIFVIGSAADQYVPKEGSTMIKLEYNLSFFNFSHSNLELMSLFDIGYDKCKIFLQKEKLAI